MVDEGARTGLLHEAMPSYGMRDTPVQYTKLQRAVVRRGGIAPGHLPLPLVPGSQTPHALDFRHLIVVAVQDDVIRDVLGWSLYKGLRGRRPWISTTIGAPTMRLRRIQNP